MRHSHIIRRRDHRGMMCRAGDRRPDVWRADSPAPATPRRSWCRTMALAAAPYRRRSCASRRSRSRAGAHPRPHRLPQRRRPSQIERKLGAPASNAPRPADRVTIREFKRRPELRRAAPSIDIQSINFAFGSAEIPYSQYGKVENIATALERLLRRRPDMQVLIEGHTDAVGSDYSNQILSEARASSLKRLLVREFGMPVLRDGDGRLRRALPARRDALRGLAQPPRHAAPHRRVRAVAPVASASFECVLRGSLRSHLRMREEGAPHPSS